MLIEQTLEKLNAMKLSGMAEALKQPLGSGEGARLSFEERLGLLVDAEWLARERRKLERRLRSAKLRYAANSNSDLWGQPLPKSPRGRMPALNSATGLALPAR